MVLSLSYELPSSETDEEEQPRRERGSLAPSAAPTGTNVLYKCNILLNGLDGRLAARCVFYG